MYLGVASSELHTSRVSGTISRALLATNGREASDTWSLLADTSQHVNRGNVADIIGNLELAIGTGSLGVDNTLGDSLPVEMGEKINQVEVLKQERTIGANSLPARRMMDGIAIGGSVHRLLIVPKGRCGLLVGNHDYDQ